MSFPKSVFRLLLIVICFNTHQYSFAWDVECHQAVGMTTMSSLLGKAATHVRRLMNGHDVVDVAAWGHHIEPKHPKTGVFHFQLQREKGECSKAVISEENCPQNHCLVRALQHFYGRVTGRPNLVPLKYPDGLQLTDSDAVKMIVNLIGDLHQPLHIGFYEDQGGKNITLVYTGARHQTETSTLFDYWDSGLAQKMIAERPGFWYGGWTHTHSLGDNLAILRNEWDSTPTEEKHLLFERWATESLQLACSRIYKDISSGSEVPNGFIVSNVYEVHGMELIQSQILKAGARIGFVLNTILSERSAGKLRQGSGVDIALDNERVVPVADSSIRYIRSFGINMMIILIVLAILAYVTRFYAPSTPAAQATAYTRVVASNKQIEKRS